MKNRPVVSVIIPVYNGERFLAETVESVLAQDYHPLEVVVVNDGSTDDTDQEVAPYRDSIRYVFQQNAGVSAARNHGFRLARGEYIVFFDGDDLMLPGKLSDQAELLEQEPSLGYVHSGWHQVDAQGRLLKNVERWQQAPHLSLEAWLTVKPIYLGAMMFRRCWVERVGGFDPELTQSEDMDWLFRLILGGCEGTWLRRPTVCYRQHPNSATQNKVQAAAYSNQVLAKFFERSDLPDRIRSLESIVRFSTLTWCVSQLYQSGNEEGIVPYLRKSLSFSDGPPARTAVRWLGFLIIQSGFTQASEIDRLRSLFPVFKEVIQVEEAHWERIERLLNLFVRAEAQRRSLEITIPPRAGHARMPGDVGFN